MERGTVILDLDGTLVDSAPDLADALDLLLAERGLEPVGLEETRKLIGHGIQSLVRRGFARQGAPLEGAELEEASARFRAFYAERLPGRAALYPEVEEGLDALAARGWRLVVCTNKFEGFARALLKGLGVLDRFALVAGPDTFGAAKPDPAHLLHTLPDGGRAHRAVMVGDSEIDLQAARAAGIPMVAVSYGYAKVPLRELGPDAIVDGFGAVPEAVERLASPARTGGRAAAS